MKRERTIAILVFGLGGLLIVGACGGGGGPPVGGTDSAGTGAIVFHASFPTAEDQIALYKEKYGTLPPANEIEASARALSRFVYYVYVSLTDSVGGYYDQVISPGMTADFYGILSGTAQVYCAQWDSWGYIIPQEIYTTIQVPSGSTAWLYLYFIDGWEPNDNNLTGVTDLTPPDGGGSVSQDHTLQRNTDGSGTDEDWFSFYVYDSWVSRGDVIQMETTNLYNADTYMYLYDSAGNQLAADDDGGVGLASLINFGPVASAGYYYVNIRPFSSDSGAYDMTVRDLPGGTPGAGDIIIVPG